MPNSVPFRLRVLQALTTLLESANPAGGYTFDLNGKVIRGRAYFGEETPLPFISILEAPTALDGVDASTGGQTTVEWDILLQGFIQDDPVHPTDQAYYLMADIKKALAQERNKKAGPRMGNSNSILNMQGRVDDIVIGSGTVRPADEISATSYFWLRVTLKIVEDNSNPFG